MKKKKMRIITLITLLLLSMNMVAVAYEHGNDSSLEGKMVDEVVINNNQPSSAGIRLKDITDLEFSESDIDPDSYSADIALSGIVEVDIQFEEIQRVGHTNAGDIMGHLSLEADGTRGTITASAGSGYEFVGFRYYWIYNEDGFDPGYDPGLDELTEGAFELNVDVDDNELDVEVDLADEFLASYANVTTPPALEIGAHFEPEIILYVEADFTLIPEPVYHTINVEVAGDAGTSSATLYAGEKRDSEDTAVLGDDASLTVLEGTSLEFYLDVASGYRFVGWNVDELPETAEESATYIATFEPIPEEVYYTIEIIVDGNAGNSLAKIMAGTDGSVDEGTATKGSNASITVPAGTSLDFLVEAQSGYSFVEWDTDELPDYAETDGVYTATFSKNSTPKPKYTLIITQEGEGSVKTGTFNDLRGDYEIGKIVPAEGWQLDGIFGDDVDGPDDTGIYTINMNSDKEIDVVFSKIPEGNPGTPPTLTIVVEGEGNIESQTVDFMVMGETFTFGPLMGESGYSFDSIGGPSGDDLLFVDLTTYEIVMNEDKEIHILFDKEVSIPDTVLPQTGGLPIVMYVVGGLVSIGAGIKMKQNK